MTRKSSKIKTAILFAFFVVLPVTAVEASAQIKNVEVDVPFAFTANHTSFPAGHYRILGDNDLLTVQNADNGRSKALLLTRGEPSQKASWPGKLEFYVSGSRHVLTEVRFGGSSTHNVLLRQPKPERVVAGNSEPAKTIEIATR